MVSHPPASPVRASLAGAALLLVCAATPARAAEEPQGSAPPVARSPSFTPSAALDLAALERLVTQRSAALESAKLEVDLAATDVRQSRLFENPVLDASWGTIPVGPTNPADLKAPYASIPNYGLGLSYTFLLGKRGPRQDRALALQQGKRAALDQAAREQALDLARLLGGMATTTLRLAGVRGLVGDGKRAVALTESRLAATFATPLDVERLRIEVSRAEQQILSGESTLSANLAACSTLTGVTCEGFPSSDEAKAFLAGWIGRAGSTGAIEERPDVRALDAYRQAASAEISLARAQAIPDPTVRLGYLHDQFVASGAQANSLSLSVSVPLPIFDHGQALAAAAAARKAHLSAERDKTIQTAKARIPELLRRVQAQKARQAALSSDIIPRARGVLKDVEHAAESRLLSLADVIQANRTVSELLVEEADSYGDAFEATIELAAELPDGAAAASPAAKEPPR